MNATETVEEYYESLRRGDSLSPYFAEREDVVKFGVSERLAGYEAVADGLREQTRTTDEWRVESRALRVIARETVARFTDDVAMSWTVTDESGPETRHSFETRWSGVLERDDVADDEKDRESGGTAGRWRFVQMHVSAPHEL
ncbi:nuclear transport factor 2 family protein [Halorussus gelatinilyticus]|uniref:Nuclear transport factor 2 family protein n=1 Tax=Halorussus gelatinilyticus TaxID=2937524 RepID=A0A8U0IIY2_9EURY|nr:nuclear transport factor 2 family protein [Halorussus gelatinilyticus]UPW00758.1 nuclear transport factor 2 family protein [Halorussus gelatinilyticus]